MDLQSNGAAVSPAAGGKLGKAWRRILGATFYTGDLAGLIELARQGGLIVVPAAPALATLPYDRAYCAAIERSDFAITDSGFMVVLWWMFRRDRLQRISGLRFLTALLRQPDFLRSGATFWVMPSETERESGYIWLQRHGANVEVGDFYIAPKYAAGPLQDAALLRELEARRPRFIVLNIGGGVQERLGLYLRDNLSYRPAIVCTGAALAFLTRAQANIPPWADRLMLGWFMRILNDPKRFIPRYWRALALVPILWRHGANPVPKAQ